MCTSSNTDGPPVESVGNQGGKAGKLICHSVFFPALWYCIGYLFSPLYESHSAQDPQSLLSPPADSHPFPVKRKRLTLKGVSLSIHHILLIKCYVTQLIQT